MSKRNIENYQENETSTVTREQNWKCSAFHCQLPGGMSNGHGAEAKFYCRFHYGKEWHQNDAITRALKPYNDLLLSIAAIQTREHVLSANRALEAKGFDDLCVTGVDVDWPDIAKYKMTVGLNRVVRQDVRQALGE